MCLAQGTGANQSSDLGADLKLFLAICGALVITCA
jgi:hypothetical protein